MHSMGWEFPCIYLRCFRLARERRKLCSKLWQCKQELTQCDFSKWWKIILMKFNFLYTILTPIKKMTREMRWAGQKIAKSTRTTKNATKLWFRIYLVKFSHIYHNFWSIWNFERLKWLQILKLQSNKEKRYKILALN